MLHVLKCFSWSIYVQVLVDSGDGDLGIRDNITLNPYKFTKVK
jgi:hypothetical protein